MDRGKSPQQFGAVARGGQGSPHDLPDAQIVGCKRSIDALNQRRNDAVEALDN